MGLEFCNRAGHYQKHFDPHNMDDASLMRELSGQDEDLREIKRSIMRFAPPFREAVLDSSSSMTS